MIYNDLDIIVKSIKKSKTYDLINKMDDLSNKLYKAYYTSYEILDIKYTVHFFKLTI